MPDNLFRQRKFGLSTVACALATMGFISSCSFLLASFIFPSLRLKLPLRVESQASRRSRAATSPCILESSLKTCPTEQRCILRNPSRQDSSTPNLPSSDNLDRDRPSLPRSASSPLIRDPSESKPKPKAKSRLRPLSDPIPMSVKFLSAAKRTMSQSSKLTVFPMKRECTTSAHARTRSTDVTEVQEVEGKNESPKRFKAVRRQTIAFESHVKKTTTSLTRLQRRASRSISITDNWDKTTLLRPFIDRRNTRQGFA